jgi:hypothetical protein
MIAVVCLLIAGASLYANNRLLPVGADKYIDRIIQDDIQLGMSVSEVKGFAIMQHAASIQVGDANDALRDWRYDDWCAHVKGALAKNMALGVMISADFQPTEVLRAHRYELGHTYQFVFDKQGRLVAVIHRWTGDCLC